MYNLTIHENAETDLLGLFTSEPVAAARFAVLLQEIGDSQELLGCLLEKGFGADRSEEFNVDKWVARWRKGEDIWRLKDWELEGLRLNYRVIYAYHIKDRCFHILAIVPRSFNYEENSPISKRIFADYLDLT